MNERTVTHNDQLSELTNALKPSPAKPEPLSSTWPVLHDKAMITAQIANQSPWPNDPPDDCVLAVVIVLVIGIASVFKLIKE